MQCEAHISFKTRLKHGFYLFYSIKAIGAGGFDRHETNPWLCRDVWKDVMITDVVLGVGIWGMLLSYSQVPKANFHARS